MHRTAGNVRRRRRGCWQWVPVATANSAGERVRWHGQHCRCKDSHGCLRRQHTHSHDNAGWRIHPTRRGAMSRDSATRGCEQGKREDLLLKSRTTPERWSETECEDIGHLGVRFVPASADPNLCWALSRASWNALLPAHHRQVLLYRAHIALPAPSGCHVRVNAAVRQVWGTIANRRG